MKRPPTQGQRFDGISIVPALKGRALRREAIFTYFPHNPKVPDWLPPAVAVHQEDWKLIRVFYGGEDGSHRWRLYDLGEDIGEKKDLAGSQRQRVDDMRARLHAWYREVDAKFLQAKPNGPKPWRP